MCIQIVTRADDCGLGTGTNRAVYQAARSGFIRNVSFLACGPAIREAAELFRDLPQVCCGIHLTLTGEWSQMPIKPVLPRALVPSLVDENGCFYPDTGFGGKTLEIGEILREWEAQLKLLRGLGLHIQYADTHMFPELAVPGLEAALSRWMEAQGLIDHRYFYRALPCMDDMAHIPGLFEKLLPNLPDGTYFYLCHPAEPGGSEVMGNPSHPREQVEKRRQEDYLFAASLERLQWCQERGIVPVSYAEAKPTTASCRDWLQGGSYGGYRVEALDLHTFRIQDGFGDHIYLVEGKNQCAVIDTGMGFPGLGKLVSLLSPLPSVVLCTHGHLDHIGSVGEFLCMYLHPADWELLNRHADPAYRRKKVEALARELGVVPTPEATKAMIHLQIPKDIRPLSPGQLLDLGGRTLEVLHTPGHTQGSVCFYDRAGGLLFSGDTLCARGVMLSFPESTDIPTFLQTIAALSARIPRDTRIYPGHHTQPLTAGYFEKYLECGKRTLAHPQEGRWEASLFGKFRRYEFEDVSLTYPGE